MASTNIYQQAKGLALIDHQNYPEGIKEYMALEEAFLLNNLQGAKSLLEVGCGDGRYLEMLASVVGEILGIDYSEYLVNLSRKRTNNFPNVKVIHGNAKDLPSLLSKTYKFATLAWNTIGNMPPEIHPDVFRGLSQWVEEKIFISTYQCSDAVMKERLKLYENCGYKVNSINGNQVIMEDGEHTAYAYPINYFQDLMESNHFSMETYEFGFCGVMIVGTKQDFR
ncbi:MAG: class I SAM-dependent methyltransferase [Nostocaceae cyanobacterium]|nr:class I SAM-dependent methyltransferase [Nostocaceae cyanobacterium]